VLVGGLIPLQIGINLCPVRYVSPRLRRGQVPAGDVGESCAFARIAKVNRVIAGNVIRVLWSNLVAMKNSSAQK